LFDETDHHQVHMRGADVYNNNNHHHSSNTVLAFGGVVFVCGIVHDPDCRNIDASSDKPLDVGCKRDIDAREWNSRCRSFH
jgi:hypothetical protein